jgi:hypothetical protein
MRIFCSFVLTVTLAACGGSPKPAPAPAPGPTPEPAAACFKGGCGGQTCSDQEGVITTCEFRPEHACYASATCERQADGACGWTQTAELTACLADPPSE